ncbi:hypothetical protein BDZ94DRAFT_1255595 [Collybia nuda]|uniref:Uncharacterized protein n=1 Tax=Collybia nuda TaxID=64659 RepID=A0A9P5Y9L8_9AGAR|nr:hypothetical protein BDZ94DRAFT_1255595 [Collybia nuda]
MSLESIDLIPLEQRLSQLTIGLRNCDSEQSWKEIENISHTLANGLRVRDGLVDNHSMLGKTTLLRNLTALLNLAMHGSPTPPDASTSAVFELLRVAANICMDHDENRARLLEAELLETLISLLEGYLAPTSIPLAFTPIKLSLSHLKVIKTAIGVLLNASIGFEPVKFKLISLDAVMTVLKLSTAVYPPGFWIRYSPDVERVENFVSEDAWEVRSGLANWAWRVISELKDVKDETLQIFTPDILPVLTVPLLAFSLPYPSRLSTLSKEDPVIIATLVDTDFEILQESCMLIESLSLDVEDIRLSLARGLNFPAEHSGVPCLSAILDFIENGDYPPFWNLYGEVERKRKEKAFDICKAALIKAVVEVAGEESNEDVLWDDSEEENPGGNFVSRMVAWIKRYVDDIEMTPPPQTLQPRTLVDRDDLAICASLTLGNLARRGKITTALLSPPHSLAPVLTSQKILTPSADIKVKHGVLGLLKNLSQTSTQSPSIQNTLGNASIVHRITESGIWGEQADAMAEIVQLNAIGVVKHMCNANVEHTFALVLPSEELSSPSSTTGLTQILALIKRSDSVSIKSEGTRVLVNVVKSLWSSDFANAQLTETLKSPNSAKISNKETLQEKQRKRAAAIRETLFPDYVEALSGLVGRSGKYPLLVNEGVVALSLISTQKEGGPLVLKAITAPLSLDASAPTADTPPSSTDVALSVTANTQASARLPVPLHALDMLLFALKNVDNPANFPSEVRANICSFFIQLGRHTSGDELNKVRDAVREVLVQLLDEDTLHGGQTRVDTFHKAIRRLMDTF